MRQRFNPDGDDAAKSASRRTRLVVIANDDPRAGVPIPTTTSPFSSPPRIISLPARALRASRARSSAPPHASRPLGLDDGGAQDRGALGRRAHARPRGRPGHARRGPAPAAADRPAPPPAQGAPGARDAAMQARRGRGDRRVPHPPRPRRFRRRAPPPGRRRARDDRSARRRRGHLPPRPELDRVRRSLPRVLRRRRRARRGRPRRRREGPRGERQASREEEGSLPAADRRRRHRGVRQDPRGVRDGRRGAPRRVRADDAPRCRDPRRRFRLENRRRRRLRRLRRRLPCRRDPKPRAERATRGPVRDPALARPKKEGTPPHPDQGEKNRVVLPRGEDPRRRPSEEDDARSGGRSVRVQGRRRRRARRRGRRLEPLGEPRRGG